MQPKVEWRGVRSVRLFMILLVFVLAAVPGSAQTAATGAQHTELRADPFHRINLLDNERVTVYRLTFVPGQRTDPPGKTHGDLHDVVVLLLTPGEIEMNTGQQMETVRAESGKTWWLPKSPVAHSLANVGKEPWDVIVVSLKESYEPAQRSVQPSTTTAQPAARPRVDPFQRVVFLDNDRVIAYRLTFQPGQRTDPAGRTHPDPRDGVVIMMTPGEIEFYTGDKVEVGHQEPGKAWWMPKPPFMHSLANVGYVREVNKGPWDVIVVSLK